MKDLPLPPLDVRTKWISDKLHFFSPSCQIELWSTLRFIGSNDPRLLPADQSHVNACCSDEEGLLTWKRYKDGQELPFN